jgi:hypothetical protein
MKRRKVNMENMNDHAVGIDIGEKESVATYMSPSGDVIEQFTFPMNSDGYKEFREKIPSETRIAFEASGMAYVVFNNLRPMGYESITVAHPKELAWIVKSKKKNDRVDSLKLAKLHLVGMLPESNLLSEEDRIFRDLLIQRAKLGQEITKMKTSIISYLKMEGLFNSLPESSENFSDKRRKAMDEHHGSYLLNLSFYDEGMEDIFGKANRIIDYANPLTENGRKRWLCGY